MNRMTPALLSILVAAALFAVASLSAQDKVGDAIVACVGADRVFRLGVIDRGCAPGEQRYVLSPAKPEMEDPKVVNSDEAAARKVPSEARVAALEEHVKQLQSELLKALELASNSRTVKAPFLVVDSAGKPILRVDEKLPSLSGAGARVTIAGGDDGNYAVRVFNPGGQLVAGVGQSREGTGLVTVADKAGVQRIRLNGDNGTVTAFNTENIAGAQLGTTTDGKGFVRIMNDGSTEIGLLIQGASGGGVLQLNDAAGTPSVQAGTLANGAGIVRTGPMSLPMLPGIPGSFIMGKR